jgi:hypothetical protein
MPGIMMSSKIKSGALREVAFGAQQHIEQFTVQLLVIDDQKGSLDVVHQRLLRDTPSCIGDFFNA